jgi:hypothetical protein
VRNSKRLLLTLLLVLPTACLIRVRAIEVQKHTVTGEPVTIQSPVRAHLADGSVVVYRGGVTVQRDTLLGAGDHLDALRARLGVRGVVPLDSVIGLESFRVGTNTDATMLASIPTTVVGTGLAANSKCAHRPSSPTTRSVGGLSS